MLVNSYKSHELEQRPLFFKGSVSARNPVLRAKPSPLRRQPHTALPTQSKNKVCPHRRIAKGLTARTTLTRAEKAHQVLPPASDNTFMNSSPEFHSASTRRTRKQNAPISTTTRFPFPVPTSQIRVWHAVAMMMGFFTVATSKEQFSTGQVTIFNKTSILKYYLHVSYQF